MGAHRQARRVAIVATSCALVCAWSALLGGSVLGGGSIWGVSLSGAAAAPTKGAPGRPVAVQVAAGGPAGRRIDENLLGLDSVTPGSAPLLRAIGIRWARLDVSFEATLDGQPVYDCATGAWNPSQLDGRLAGVRAAGASPVVIVDYTPPCLALHPKPGTNPSYSPPDLGPDAARWEALVREMALHEIAVEHVRAFEVWNEPNLFFWTGTRAQYFTLYANTVHALQAAAAQLHRRIEVGGPALGDIFANTPDMPWVRAFVSYVAEHHLPLDFFSLHEYANNPDVGPEPPLLPTGLCIVGKRNPDGQCDNPGLDARSVGGEVARVRAVLARHPRLHPLVWLDEWNVNAGQDPRMSGTYGAAFVAAVLASAQRSGLNRSCLYNAADDNFGILTAGLVPKPDYYTFGMWHQMAGHVLPTSLQPGQDRKDPVGRIGVVASRSAGVVHLLAFDFAPTGPTGTPGQPLPARLAHGVTVRVTGLSPGVHTMTRSLIDTTHEGVEVSHRTVEGRSVVARFTLRAQSVTELTVTPAARTWVRARTTSSERARRGGAGERIRTSIPEGTGT